LEHLLSQRKAAILKRWLDLIADTYPTDTSRFLRRDKDRFANPVGYIISGEIGAIFEELLHEMNPDKLTASLDNIIRIRSVQDFPPSQAIAFIFLLKQVVREELSGEIEESQSLKQLLEFESKIDKLALLALDIYVKCREKIHQITVGEVRAEREMVLRVLERVNVLSGENGEGVVSPE